MEIEYGEPKDIGQQLYRGLERHFPEAVARDRLQNDPMQISDRAPTRYREQLENINDRVELVEIAGNIVNKVNNGLKVVRQSECQQGWTPEQWEFLRTEYEAALKSCSKNVGNENIRLEEFGNNWLHFGLSDQPYRNELREGIGRLLNSDNALLRQAVVNVLDNQLNRYPHESPEVQGWLARQSNEGGRDNQLDGSSHESSDGQAFRWTEQLKVFRSEYNRVKSESKSIDKTPLYHGIRAVDHILRNDWKDWGKVRKTFRELYPEKVGDMEALKKNIRALNNSFEPPENQSSQKALLNEVVEGLKKVPEDVLYRNDRLKEIYGRFFPLKDQAEMFELKETENEKADRLARVVKWFEQDNKGANDEAGEIFLQKLWKSYENRHRKTDKSLKGYKEQIKAILSIIEELQTNPSLSEVTELDEKARKLEADLQRAGKRGRTPGEILEKFFHILKHGKEPSENLDTGGGEQAEEDLEAEEMFS